jgi:prepilin-type N-terminal cleavage/methylation domain-containing protein
VKTTIPIQLVPGSATRVPNAPIEAPAHQHRGFSLIEIMVTVALLSLIILGLLMMFTQTQRAFKQSMMDSDVMGSGRAVMGMLVREISEMMPAQAPLTTNFFVDLPSPANTPASTYNQINFAQVNSGSFQPLYQELPGTAMRRTNFIQRFFFLTRLGQDWTGIGYEVAADSPNAGVGTLYRYAVTTNVTSRFGATTLAGNFLTASVTNCTRVADGIVHLRVIPYATNGYPLFYDNFNTNAIFHTNSAYYTGVRVGNTSIRNSFADQHDVYFMSNAVPAFVELELGILEPKVFERFKAIGSANALAQRQYLSNHVAQVHVLRQRIPIRNADYSVYQ